MPLAAAEAAPGRARWAAGTNHCLLVSSRLPIGRSPAAEAAHAPLWGGGGKRFCRWGVQGEPPAGRGRWLCGLAVGGGGLGVSPRRMFRYTGWIARSARRAGKNGCRWWCRVREVCRMSGRRGVVRSPEARRASTAPKPCSSVLVGSGAGAREAVFHSRPSTGAAALRDIFRAKRSKGYYSAAKPHRWQPGLGGWCCGRS